MTQTLTDVREFTLPLGYLDASGRVHRHGLMRLATAYDEIEPLGDARVKENEAFFGLLLLSRVVTQLGDFSPVLPEVIAGLYAADFAYLQAFYSEFNALSAARPFGFPDPGQLMPQAWMRPDAADAPALPSSVETTCPQCGAELILDLAGAS
ncbi:hypothetical protein [Deinococcus sp.]|uniref:hypothetical protein n=1 Tax=Deinococcus sp. TaxID=47478 RepID=UPI003B59C36C